MTLTIPITFKLLQFAAVSERGKEEGKRGASQHVPEGGGSVARPKDYRKNEGPSRVRAKVALSLPRVKTLVVVARVIIRALKSGPCGSRQVALLMGATAGVRFRSVVACCGGCRQQRATATAS